MLLGLVLMWGTSFLFNRIALESLGPATVVTLRLGIAAVVLGAVVRAARLRVAHPPRAWVRFTLLGVVGFSLPFYLISWGQQRIDSGLAGILMAVMPLATLALAHVWIEGERMTASRASGFALGFVGIVVLVGPAALRQLGGAPSDLLRQAAVLGGALCYAANAVMARRMSDPNALVTGAAVTAAATVTILPGLFFDAPAAPASHVTASGVTPAVVAAVAWLGLVSTAAATLVYFRLIATAGPTFLSLINYFIPLVAVGAGAAVLGERPDPRALLALAMVLGGLALSEGRTRVGGPDDR